MKSCVVTANYACDPNKVWLYLTKPTLNGWRRDVSSYEESDDGLKAAEKNTDGSETQIVFTRKEKPRCLSCNFQKGKISGTFTALLLGEERNLLKFTEQTAGELADSARSMWEDFTLPATPESARTAHGQPSPPAYARTDSYTPGFPLQFPLPGQSRKTSGYGWRTDPMGGLGDDFHIGNDLAAAQGTPVLAAADGVVRMAGSHKSYGNYLRILHADGDETLYAHMQYLFVKAGECVTAGQILGTVGETGNATGPHLHFEILHRGLRYDPAEALQNAS